MIENVISINYFETDISHFQLYLTLLAMLIKEQILLHSGNNQYLCLKEPFRIKLTEVEFGNHISSFSSRSIVIAALICHIAVINSLQLI